jgi:hypothetical protein
MPLKSTFAVQYVPLSDGVELTTVTFRDAYRKLATRVLSLGALGRDHNKEASRKRKKKVHLPYFRSIYATIWMLGTTSQCGRMCNFVTRRR